ASNLNYAPGDVVANLVIAKPDAAGKVCLYSHATTNLVADVSGYFPADTGYHPVTNPARLLDTRVVSSSAGGPVAGGTAVTLQVTDRAGVPASAAAVALNVTAVEPQGAGHVTVFPCSEPQPLASNLNYAPGDIVANLVIAKPDAAGKVCLFSHATTHLVADVSGHFPTGSGFVPITNPARILETRTPGSDGDDHGDHGNHGGGPQGGSEFGIPAFDEDDFLPRRPGSGDLRLQASAAPRDPAAGPFPGIGTFRVFCEASHMGYNDPILFPGVDGASHLHLFFGNTTTDAASNLNGMRNVGNSTCDGGIADRSAYWVPALYDPGTNQIIEPWIFAAYYQSGFSGLDPATVQPIPEGLRMIVGKATATPATYAEHNTFMQGGRWGCFSGAGGPTNTGADIPDCGSNRVTLVLNFPQCWDGRNLDSPDHISHMATPAVQRVGSSFVRACPATHPVVLPSIMLQVVYQNNGNNSGDWRLVSDMYPATENGGASLHADFVNGWDPGIMDLWLNNCVRAVRDCERSELGNGQALTSRFSR
ncbi:MAG TPA: DUF1996 domain-containing protein, partial [Ilumatobacter sp.]|nr:DUF1996 domain-containing protein [Ilumatobacter sp.]